MLYHGRKRYFLLYMFGIDDARSDFRIILNAFLSFFDFFSTNNSWKEFVKASYSPMRGLTVQ